MQAVYSSINILDSLKSRYNEYLKPNIVSAVIIQFEHTVCLETVETDVVVGGLEKQTVKRIDLDVVNENSDTEGLFFNPDDTIETNAIKFIDEFSPYSISKITGLFHKEACQIISQQTQRVTV